MLLAGSNVKHYENYRIPILLINIKHSFIIKYQFLYIKQYYLRVIHTTQQAFYG